MSHISNSVFLSLLLAAALCPVRAQTTSTAVHELLANGHAKFAVVEKTVTPDVSEAYVVLTENSGQAILNYGAPYIVNKQDIGKLWSHFVNNSLSIPCLPDQIEVEEQRCADYGSFAVAFALDHSPSMTQPRAVRMQRAIQQAISSFDSRDFVSVIKFTGRVNVEVKLTNNREDYMSGFRVNGLNMRSDGTALCDAAMQSLQQLEGTSSTTKRILVLFTDGEDNASSANVGEVISLAKRLNATIHAVSYGVTDESTLSRLARETGGRLHRLHDVFDFDKIFQGIYSSLRCVYRVKVTSKPQIAHDPHVAHGGAAISIAGSYAPVRSMDFLDQIPKRGVHVHEQSNLTNALVMSVELVFIGDSDVQAADVELLDSLATVMIQRSDLALEILHGMNSSHTMTPEQVMSCQRKAQAIREVLIRRGVHPSRIQGYGGVGSEHTGSYDLDSRKTMFVLTRL